MTLDYTGQSKCEKCGKQSWQVKTFFQMLQLTRQKAWLHTHKDVRSQVTCTVGSRSFGGRSAIETIPPATQPRCQMDIVVYNTDKIISFNLCFRTYTHIAWHRKQYSRINFKLYSLTDVTKSIFSISTVSKSLLVLWSVSIRLVNLSMIF